MFHEKRTQHLLQVQSDFPNALYLQHKGNETPTRIQEEKTDVTDKHKLTEIYGYGRCKLTRG
jgi:hypothetical protein